MEFDFSRLRNGERIAAIGGVLLFILLFFDWYDVGVSVSGSGISGSRTLGSATAWQAFSVIDIYLMLVVLTAIGLAVLTATQRTPALPVTTAVITTAVAALGTLLVLFRIVDTPGPSGSESFFGATASVDVSPTFWAFVGLVAVAAITYGGYLSMREEGTTLQDVRAQASAAGQQARSAFEGGPPGTAQGSSAPPPPPPPPTAEPVAAPSAAEPPAPPPPSEPPASAPPPGDAGGGAPLS